MHQIVKNPVENSRRWLVLAVVVAAQFMCGVDAFIVNVAIPTIAAELKASSAEIEAVIAIYLIAYATLVVTGGRLGDIYGAKRVFIAGVLGFTATSLWCGLAQSGIELIAARLAQGATAALMVPQVLATLHLLFSDSARARAFAIYGVVLGLAGAAGFALGGILVTLDLAGLGWRAVFFVNVPFGLAIAAALAAVVAGIAMPSPVLLAVVLAIFGYGQGLAMPQLSSAILARVNPQSAGAASGMYGTTSQIANAAGVAAIGAVFFAAAASYGAKPALFISSALFSLAIITSAVFLSWMLRA